MLMFVSVVLASLTRDKIKVDFKSDCLRLLKCKLHFDWAFKILCGFSNCLPITDIQSILFDFRAFLDSYV